MKAFALMALLLVSIAFLGCVQPPPEGGEAGLQEESFASEEAAFNALEKELENAEDIDLAELEQALQE